MNTSTKAALELGEAFRALRETSDEGLLATFAALTHRIHSSMTLAEQEHQRAQRDQVQAEILRRMGGAR